ncbi:MAG: ribosome maturation factor RimM [Woeseiaceae bacterium]|nr:ribosome maturation factor RimM [Woeseiaceae bacterium]
MLTSNPVVLGRISGLFGVRGWVKVFSYTESREAILQYKGLLLGRDGEWWPAKTVEGRQHGKSVILHFEGTDNREQAVALVGNEIGIKRSELPALDAGHYYWSDLIGLTAIHLDGTQLGTIKELLETGSHDVMVIEGDQEILIPFVNEKIVTKVDLVNRQIHVDWQWD